MNIDDVKNAACDVAYNAQTIAQTIGTNLLYVGSYRRGTCCQL